MRKFEILITRPKLDSIETAEMFKKNKWIYSISPLLEIKKVEFREVNIPKIDLIIFTSKNAVRFSKILKIKGIENTKVVTIGLGTKNLAKNIGFSDIINIDGDQSKMLESLKKILSKDMNVLHPTWQSSNAHLKSFFLFMKCNYYPIKCYRSIKKNVCPENFVKFMRSNNNGIITLFSSRTAQSFCNEIMKYKLINFCKSKIVIVLSEAIGQELKNMEFLKIYKTKKPNFQSMIETINLIKF